MSVFFDTMSPFIFGDIYYTFSYPADLSGNYINVNAYLPATMENYTVIIYVYSSGANAGRTVGTANSSDDWETFGWDLGAHPPSGVDVNNVTAVRIRFNSDVGFGVNTTVYLDDIDFND